MLAGDGPFDNDQRRVIADAIRAAELSSRIEFSVYVGPVEGDDSHAFATQLHNSLVAPSRTIVVMVDPGRRVLEIVTGGWVRDRVDDDAVAGVAGEMTRLFADGDLVGGLTTGIRQLSERARHHV